MMNNLFYDSNKEHDLMALPEDMLVVTPCRVRQKNRMSHLHYYELRHEDEDWGRPCQLREGILVNFYGTVISQVPLKTIEELSDDQVEFLEYLAHNPHAFHFEDK